MSTWEELDKLKKEIYDTILSKEEPNHNIALGKSKKTLGKYRTLSKELIAKHGYGSDPATLILGICEEAGEVGKAFNWHHNPLYIHSPHGRTPDSVEHEVKDVLIYLAHLVNAMDLDIDF